MTGPEDKFRAVGGEVIDLRPPSRTWDAGEDNDPIAPRGWLLGTSFCRCFLSSVAAQGGTGKTSLRIAQALALATGKPITGEHVHRRSRVLLISLEDDRDELRRRVRAACIHHGISAEETRGWLFLAAPQGLVLATIAGGSVVVGPLEEFIREEVKRRKIDLVSIDPFVKSHEVNENDNSAIDKVTGIMTMLAAEMKIAVDTPHHVSKGPADPGNQDKSRGAGAFVAGSRLSYTLTEMSPDDARQLGVPAGDRRQYVRLDPSKVNIAPKATDAAWFKLVSVPLGNATPEYPRGDHVQAIEVWRPTSPWAKLSPPVINAILDQLDRGLENGQRYSGAKQARDRAAWKVIKHHVADLSDDQCRSVVETWIAARVLEEREYDDPVRRAPGTGLFVIAANRPGNAF